VEARGRRTGSGGGRRKTVNAAGQDRTHRELLPTGQRTIRKVSF